MSSEIVRLYKFYPLEKAKINLKSRRLKLSRIIELNDPFEFEPFILANAGDRKFWGDLKNAVSDTIGLVSFCDSWNNPVLWSHYAENHTGLCLGFDIRRPLAEKVRYFRNRRRLQSVKSFVENQDFPAMQYSLTAKFASWEYEREHRIFSRLSEAEVEGDMYFEPFSDDVKLKSVIIGVRAEITSQAIRDIVGQNVEVVTARKAFRSFGICEQRDARFKK